MIALVPLTYLILLIWLKLSFKKIELLELLASTNLILLGLAGLVPFLLREYAGIGYKYSIFEIMAVALALITYELVAKRKLIFFRADSSIQENTELKLGDELNADMSSSLGGKLALSVRGGRHNLISLAKKLSAPVIFLMIFGVILISRGFYLPIRGWDAISLYDARARMFLSGLSLGELKTLSQYDDFNYYYYLSYPPMTSVIHTTLYSTGFSGVMWVYALFYMSFIYYLYLLLKKLEINRLLKISLFAAVAFNPLIIGQMNIAYTNLPMMAFQTGSLYYLIKYIWDRNNKFLIISAMLLSFANWTRNLEPIFIGFVLATLYAVFTYKKLHILKKMMEKCPKSKEKVSTYAPKILNIQIKPSKIGEVIGPGGKQIRSIIEETKVQIDISNDGLVSIVSSDQDAIDKARDIVLSLTQEPEINKVYKGIITSIKPFGLFVQIFNKEGL